MPQEVAPEEDDTGDSAELRATAAALSAVDGDNGAVAGTDVASETVPSAASSGGDGTTSAAAHLTAGDAVESADASMADAAPAESSAANDAEEAPPSTRLIQGVDTFAAAH